MHLSVFYVLFRLHIFIRERGEVWYNMKKAKEGEHMQGSKIMVVDDDADIRQALRVLLETENYEVSEADNGEMALELLDETVDLMILDIMMPEKDGLSTCREVREKYTFPILFLTAKTTENDKYVGFLSGGDDYLTKPFSKMEVLTRVSAMLRRYHVYQGKGSESKEKYICIKDLKIDRNVSRVFQGDKEIVLTNTEYDILVFMAKIQIEFLHWKSYMKRYGASRIAFP